MTAQEFLNKYQGQPLLYNKADPTLAGQCVQAVCYYVIENGKPVIWRDAAEWWYSNLFPEHYERIPNSPTAVPQPGDIIVWDRNLPNSGGAGHIAVCIAPRPGTGTFVSADCNWGGKPLKAVTHNYNNVVGWLRMKLPAPTPAPAPQPSQGAEEMIANEDQAKKAYGLLRPNGGASAEEIASTAGRRTWAGFANDAQGEVNARNANLREQATKLAEQSTVINQQNTTITDLTIKLGDANISSKDKQKALEEALGKIADQNAKLSESHDQVVELQGQIAASKVPVNANWFIKFLSIFVKKKS